MKTRYLLALALAGSLAGCEDNKTNDTDSGQTADAGPGDAGDAGETTDTDAGDGAVTPVCSEGSVTSVMQNVEICTDGSPVKHVTIENFWTPGMHTSAQFYLGLDAPVAAQAPLTDGQFKLMFYNLGSMGGTLAYSYFGPESVEFEGDTSFITSASTVCLDIFPGSATTRALVVLWRDGQGGADCDDLTTLTADNAFGHTWAPEVGELNVDGKAFFYQGAGGQTPVVTLGATSAIDYADVPAPECTTAITVPTATSPAIRSYHPLCEVEGAVGHVRIEGLSLVPNHSTATVLFGLTEASIPTGPTPAALPMTLTAGQFRAQFYAGALPYVPAPRVDAYAFDGSGQVGGDYAFLRTAPSTVCFDVHDGSASAPPYLVVWRDGANGADCEDFSTLTTATAYGIEVGYAGARGAIDKSLPAYLYLSSAYPTVSSVTLFNRTATEADDVLAAANCTTSTFADVTTERYNPLCAPKGTPRHVRVDGLALNATAHGSFALLVGYDPLTGTAAAPVPADATQLWLQAYAGTPYLQARQGAEVATLFTGSPDADFLLGASTFCFDVHDGVTDTTTAANARPAYLVFWRDGQNGADCDDYATLTLATRSAIVTSYGAGITGALDKAVPLMLYRNGGATLSSVTVSSRPATTAAEVYASIP